MADWKTYLATQQDRLVQELCDLVRIPSISALSEHRHDVQKAAEWLADKLRRIGLEHVAIMPTGGHPVVYADWLHASDQPTVLIYGHFDTQPVDPLDEWEHPPFSALVQDDRLFGRGASDDKGNLMTAVAAVEAWLQTEGSLPVNVKFLLEGQEEIGSPQLPQFVSEHRALLACDLVLSADGGQYSETQPMLIVGLRGICGLQINVYGPKHDLHSGSFGGAVQNPLHALVYTLASMRTPDGRIAVKGFYDDVEPLTDEIRAQIAAIPFDERTYMAELGVDALYGEPGYTPRERIWVRPTLEINGLWGGFTGEGTKTVLPSEAHAKITCRLVPIQDPSKIIQQIADHAKNHALPGVRVEIESTEDGSRAYRIPADHMGLQAAADVLAELYGVSPFRGYMGGSIPVTTLFLDILKAYTVVFSFGLPDEQVHAPNEFYRLSSFRRGQQAYGMVLQRLAQ